jgi:hypothetical protein
MISKVDIYLCQYFTSLLYIKFLYIIILYIVLYCLDIVHTSVHKIKKL